MKSADRNTTIFVFAHKQFETERTNPSYKIVTSSDCDIKSDKLDVVKLDCRLSNIGFSEWQKIYEIWCNPDMLNKYVGIAHYHRYLKFSDDVNEVPDMDMIFNQVDVVMKVPTYVTNLRTQYAFCHNLEDYDIVMDIIKNQFPWYSESANIAEENGVMVDSNIMILRKDDFLEMCWFVFSILFLYCQKVGIDPCSDESFINYMKSNQGKYMKKHQPNDDEYLQQARICSYLAERIVAVFFTHKNWKMGTLEIVEE